jgi:hypothetical protein
MKILVLPSELQQEHHLILTYKAHGWEARTPIVQKPRQEIKQSSREWHQVDQDTDPDTAGEGLMTGCQGSAA